MKRWAGGGIILSSVATRYQLGLLLHAAVGMADEDHRLIRRRNRALRCRDIVSKRYRRVLDDVYLVAVLAQELVHILPAGTVHEATVDEDDGWLLTVLACHFSISFLCFELTSACRRASGPLPARPGERSSAGRR